MRVLGLQRYSMTDCVGSDEQKGNDGIDLMRQTSLDAKKSKRNQREILYLR